MDVRCEKCQTEYELDESRLKPGGVTVKCTNCGHMFKIRKRTNTNVGVPATAASTSDARSRPVSSKQPLTSDRPARAQSVSGDAPLRINDAPSGPNSERQWLVRLENGETKTCRELATLQQWIVAGVVSRESLISRSGKTWKCLGDIPELNQYFVIADEARAQRAAKPTSKGPAGTIMGVGTLSPSDDDEDELRTTGNFRPRAPTPPPPPQPSLPKVNPVAQTELAPSGSIPVPRAPAASSAPASRVKAPSDAGRKTAAWVGGDVKASESMAAMPQGPRGGKLAAGVDEPAFAGRVRMEPSSSPFDGGRVRLDDDDEVIASSRGSRAGMWIALVSLLVIGAAAGAIYMLVFKSQGEPIAATATTDAGAAAADATSIAVTPLDAQDTASPLAAAVGELHAGVFARMRSTLDSLEGSDDPASLAMRARLATALAQGMQDRAGFVDRAEADKLRKEAKQIVIDAAPLAQRAHAGQADSASANLAMADVLRLQGKAAPAVERYIAAARGKAGGDPELVASVALAEAQLAIRDGKLRDAEKALAGHEAPDDMRIKLALAQIEYAEHDTAEAKSQVDQVLATQPDNDVALAMYKKLETAVATTDPLPPEDTSSQKPANNGATKPANHGGGGGGGGDYDSLLARANKQAETNCSRAMDLYMKALEQKPNGVEALTGMGYCHLDAKQFSSAFSKFRAALAVSSRFEPALGGIAETYQRQGNKEAAIAAWRKYLDVYPGSPKAKKQLELLGASDKPKEAPKPSEPSPGEQPQKPSPSEQPQKPSPGEQPQKPSPSEQPVTDPGASG